MLVIKTFKTYKETLKKVKICWWQSTQLHV